MEKRHNFQRSCGGTPLQPIGDIPEIGALSSISYLAHSKQQASGCFGDCPPMAPLRNSLRWVSVFAGILLALSLCIFGGSNGVGGGLSGDSFWRYVTVTTSSSRNGISRELISSQADDGRRARLAFLVLCSGKDVGRLQLLLPEIYHPDNIYLVHVDAKTPTHAVCVRSRLRVFVFARTCPNWNIKIRYLAEQLFDIYERIGYCCLVYWCCTPGWFRYHTALVTNPFRTAVPVWGQTSQTSSTLSPKRDCGSKRLLSLYSVG